tara:strand:- start:495 stop:827 length:333 start_codon:yes stop_codon:yes gene_type:complete
MSHHIPDPTKMINDTPRMDASAYDDGAIWETGCDIERELKAATSEVERLRKANLQLREGAEEQKQRIKQLEEAGDAVAAIIGPPGSAHWADENQVDAAWNNWRKAKEAKL